MASSVGTTLLDILGIVLGAAENVVPVFIKNPASQKIESVVVGEANSIFSELASLLTPAAPTPASTTTTTTSTSSSSGD